MNILELLAPAKNLECGIVAIHHGADAVYIGAPKFGAREAAGNSIEEIEKLASEARLFGVKTYVALNTILYDNELAEAERIIRQVYEAGADALIIQDMGILEMNLPPIALHASTQANNFTVDKIKFLGAVGFKRAVLARELSLQQIEEISAQTTIELEAFVHGSLCVCLSGQCFMSHSIGGRSANRGACAQPCRKKYSLTDATGKSVIRDKHLLSLKDLNRSQSIGELVAAGVRTFKIEGRLKEIDYVKNITAFYRLELDRFMDGKTEFAPLSLGKTTIFFTPDPAKTFHRGATDYFMHGRKDSVAGIDSPKSIGEAIGKVVRVGRDNFQLSGTILPGNNDGLTFLNRLGESAGLKVNRVENKIIFTDRMNGLFVGAVVSRNYDHAFQTTLGKKTAERKIPIALSLLATTNGFELKTATGMGTLVSFAVTMDKIQANDPKKSHENILRQLAKSGDTPFLASNIDTGGNEQYFFTAQQLNELRRGLLEQLTAKLSAKKLFQPLKIEPSDKQINLKSDFTYLYPSDSFHFENNISNRMAMQFYRRHGLEFPEMAVEKRAVTGRFQVMITKHCIQHELGFCTRFGGTFPNEFALPFSLKDGISAFELEFDCKVCMMRVFKE